MLTVDESLRFARQMYTPQSFAGVLCAEIEHLRAELAAREWRTIESAPRDYSGFDVWSQSLKRVADCSFGVSTYGKESGVIYQSDYDCDGPVLTVIRDASHWMPLPPEPKP